MREKRKARVEGMGKAAAGHDRDLLVARTIALDCARYRTGYCTVDDVRDETKRRGYGIDFSLPWAGSIFKDGNWEFFSTEKAHHRGSHARRVSVWRLRAGYKYPSGTPLPGVIQRDFFN